MSQPQGVFFGTIKVKPPTGLQLNHRPVGQFQISSVSDDEVEARFTAEDAETLFRGEAFLDELRVLAWDLAWEKQVVVEFEPDQGKRVAEDVVGRQLITMDIQETAYFNQGNPRAGIKSFTNFDLLQRIRDRIVSVHIANGDPAKARKLMADAAILIAVEHFIKGVVNRQYALAEFYSLAETVENQLGGRHQLTQLMTKAKLDKITSLANQDRYDQRHGPKNPANIVPLPPNAIEEAAAVAREIVLKYAAKIV